ncbi:MAG: transporter, family, multidrug resistance protein [Actinomycetota bacterium]|nr:transporter, family, multidrug resistance protein [Actinomycetota bacterium]
MSIAAIGAKPFRGLPPEVAALSGVAFCVAVGFGVVAPAIPLFAHTFGVGRAEVGAVLSAFAFMRLASALGVGRAIDAVGERVVLASGIAIVAVSSALAGLAHSYLQLLVLRGIGGIGSAMFSVSAMGLLLRVVAPTQRGRSVGLFQGGFLLGGISGPAIGGPLAAWSIRAPFFVYAGTLVAAGLVAMIGLRNSPLAPKPNSSDADQPRRTGLAEALRQPSYRAALSANLADAWAAMGVRNTLVPLFVVESLHRGTGWVGAGFAVVAATNAAVLIPGGHLVDRRGRRPVIVAGCVIAGLAMVLLAVAPDIVGYIAAMLLFGIGSGLLDVAPAAVVGDVAGKRGGTVVAAFQMAGDAGSVSGPIIAGSVADTWSYGTAFLVTGGVLLAAGALAARAPDVRPAPEFALAQNG